MYMLNLLHLVVLSASVAPPVDFFFGKVPPGIEKNIHNWGPLPNNEKKNLKKNL